MSESVATLVGKVVGIIEFKGDVIVATEHSVYRLRSLPTCSATEPVEVLQEIATSRPKGRWGHKVKLTPRKKPK